MVWPAKRSAGQEIRGPFSEYNLCSDFRKAIFM